MIRHIAKDGAQIFQIEQSETLLVGNAKRDVEDTFLRVVELQEA